MERNLSNLACRSSFGTRDVPQLLGLQQNWLLLSWREAKQGTGGRFSPLGVRGLAKGEWDTHLLLGVSPGSCEVTCTHTDPSTVSLPVPGASL